ncbi:uncharacterized protein JN550_013699 [Neoarthrinium moseri]|uniref:uncharacterized protein n=1 Tax=Neoarthrinium moseri TaxID=1658444 RepID=UPI001FDDDFEE|nr:uncharacterized protein JN550_013699 [Neoarthrinium moseri]KAI1856705.1 hypothetical protein JN550_013699 [Neoarthrinium moseri]
MLTPRLDSLADCLNHSHRCRVRHQRCDISSNDSSCSSCERAGTTCRGGGRDELQIRFSQLGKKPRNRSSKHSTKTKVPKLHVTKEPDTSVSNDSTQGSVALGPAASGDTGNLLRSELIDLITRKSNPGNALPPTKHVYETSLSNQDAAVAEESNQIAADDVMIRADVAVESPNPRRIESHNYQGEGDYPALDHTGTGLHTHFCVGPLRNTSAVTKESSNLQTLWPLQTQEAQLIKYFLTVLVGWFDYCDPHTSFKTHVQSAITTDATILYAVLAISARHRELTMGIGNHKGWVFGVSDAIATFRGNDSIAVHAVSAPVILRIKQGNIETSSFSHAAIIVALRQEIFVANMTMRPIVEGIMDYCNNDCNVATGSKPNSEAIWTHRIIVHAARVTNYTYTKKPKDVAEWDRLHQYLHEWNTSKPASFEPINHVFDKNFRLRVDEDQWGAGVTESSGHALPLIYYSHDCPVAAQQYLQLCRILLLSHDPRAPPRLGLGRACLIQAQENEIRNSVRIICGIAQSNPEYMPARLTVGMVIAMCGELFSDSTETTQLLRMVTEAEMHLGWPCLKVRDRLKSFWDL